MNNRKIAIVVAGGKGERMNTDIPKQFIELNGRPILMHTLEVFRKFDAQMTLILVLPASQKTYWEMLCKKHAFTVSHNIAEGGSTRFHSVQNGLKAAHLSKETAFIAIHDGVRPFVNHDTISACFAEAERSRAAIPVIEMVDSLRQITDDGSISVDRSKYKMVQTPQVFEFNLIQNAYQQPFSDAFTDDASVVEAFGNKVTLVEGNRENIKITTHTDLIFAEAIIQSKK